MRRVVHRRLTLVQSADVVCSSIIALVLAWQGASLWALLATDLITALVSIAGFYLWRPFWHPRFTWDPQAVRYFLGFGSRNFIAATLQYALDRVDDLWVEVSGQSLVDTMPDADKAQRLGNGLLGQRAEGLGDHVGLLDG